MSDRRILIAGSGVVGLACAASLARLNHQLVVLGDRPEKFVADSDYGLRVYALNVATRRLLSAIGVWEEIEKSRSFSYEAMHVYDGAESLDFHATDIGTPELGFIVEDALVRARLFEYLSKQPNVSLLCPQRLCDWVSLRNGYRVTLSDHEIIEADLLIGADGACSEVRSQAGIKWREVDYAQSAIVATVRLEGSHRNACWQWFHRDSILAFLPLTENSMSIVWSCTQSLAETLMRSSAQDFSARLYEYSDGRLGKFAPAFEKKIFPLSGGVADAYVAGDIVLVGDAAHCVHPLAGQGANLGFADVSCLAEVLSDGDINHSALRRYERRMKSRNILMKYSLEQIKMLFSTEKKSVMTLRRAGLRLVNQCMPLKTFFIHHAEEG